MAQHLVDIETIPCICLVTSVLMRTAYFTELLFDMHVTTPEIIFELDDAAPLLGTSPQMPCK